ncbi:transglutaminase [Termitidicoccus mucosus]|uniref:Transglutaminase n=2 Tax=Termitidicoccus mucosus TaxID=1184151 RepID=A0A178IH73_9BACT|nr:transglutaminase [Opitutaceae bacterium TSB47]
MRLEIFHLTRYEYDREVQIHPHLLYLRPRENPLLQVNRFAFFFQPEARVDWMRDDFDNLPASAQFFLNTAVLEIRSECTVTTADTPPFDFLVRDYARAFPFAYEPLHRFNLSIYLTPPDDATRAALLRWLDSRFVDRPAETVGWLFAFNQVINRNLAYQRRDEAGIQSALATINLGSGSCRDFAVLFIECARALGIAARFVSGYLFDPSGNGSRGGDMHAWAEVFLPGAGWKGIDPTHGIFCDNAYVPVAHAVVAESVNPVQGSFVSVIPTAARLTTDVRVRQSS